MILADTVIHVSDDEVIIEADLSSATDKVYHLIINNNAGSDTLDAALVVYTDPVDLERVTVSGFADADRFPSLPDMEVIRQDEDPDC